MPDERAREHMRPTWQVHPGHEDPEVGRVTPAEAKRVRLLVQVGPPEARGQATIRAKVRGPVKGSLVDEEQWKVESRRVVPLDCLPGTPVLLVGAPGFAEQRLPVRPLRRNQAVVVRLEPAPSAPPSGILGLESLSLEAATPRPPTTLGSERLLVPLSFDAAAPPEEPAAQRPRRPAAPARVRVEALDPFTRLEVVDREGRVVVAGVGGVEAEVPPGAEVRAAAPGALVTRTALAGARGTVQARPRTFADVDVDEALVSRLGPEVIAEDRWFVPVEGGHRVGDLRLGSAYAFAAWAAEGALARSRLGPLGLTSLGGAGLQVVMVDARALKGSAGSPFALKVDDVEVSPSPLPALGAWAARVRRDPGPFVVDLTLPGGRPRRLSGTLPAGFAATLLFAREPWGDEELGWTFVPLGGAAVEWRTVRAAELGPRALRLRLPVLPGEHADLEAAARVSPLAAAVAVRRLSGPSDADLRRRLLDEALGRWPDFADLAVFAATLDRRPAPAAPRLLAQGANPGREPGRRYSPMGPWAAWS